MSPSLLQSSDPEPPEHVRAAFGVWEETPELLPHGPVWRCGDVVLRPVEAAAQAAWVAQTLDALHAEGLRLARPLRSSDGRWVVGGWSATRYLEGRCEPRHDEVIAVSLRLHAATAGLPRPRFLDDRDDLWAVADAVAWGERDAMGLPGGGGELFAELADLAAARRPVALRPQVVHGDLFGNVLFAGSAPPAVIDLVPYWRPPEWAAAVVAVDALAWGGADPGLVQRWASLPGWPQVLLRALLFRVAAHAAHPLSTAESLAGLRHAAKLIRDANEP
ncbi:MAG TPA: TIGR02569 family protein [Pseudonocardiaceae bacterium]|nr:TIGR02569 family protein [Pseudonocardiaceae bacterium]